ncbi:capsid protein [Lepus americanus faeces associated genomovirus SHP11]|nr:capsid protein [Lepus americanus faeces associated genomovirus SHP11]
MAQRRKFTSYRAKRRTRRSARPAKYGGRKRRWTKTRKTSRPMTKKRILNTTSRKKRNGMLTWSNTNLNGTVRPIASGNAYVAATNVGVFVYCPTALHLDGDSLLRNPAARTSSTIFAKGLSERMRIQTSSGLPWFHRRVCFTTKGPNAFNVINSTDTPTVPWAPYLDTSNGIERPMINLDINAMPGTLGSQYGLLFKGRQGVDWNDTIIAPLDTARVTVKYDKTWTLQSGNANGVIRERKLWHPMNHNVVYDEDEDGEVQGTSYYSVDSKAGMGDYYVVDFFQAGVGGTSTDLISVNASSTMYWHEK